MVVGKLGISADLAGRKCGVGKDGASQRELFREFQKGPVLETERDSRRRAEAVDVWSQRGESRSEEAHSTQGLGWSQVEGSWRRNDGVLLWRPWVWCIGLECGVCAEGSHPEVKEPVSRRVGSSAEGEGEGWPLKVGKGCWVQARPPRGQGLHHAHVRASKRPAFTWLCLEFSWDSVISSDVGSTVACRPACCPALVIVPYTWS